MPYIDPQRRPEIFEESSPEYEQGVETYPATAYTMVSKIETVGELNYAITEMINWYLAEVTDSLYADYNAIVGVLECAKLEFYRRAVAKYEDEKIMENGDVYNV